MSEISLEEFRKLNVKEQRKRYKDLSNHDKSIFRLTDPAPFINAETTGYVQMTEEEKEKNEKKKKEIMEAIRRNRGN